MITKDCKVTCDKCFAFFNVKYDFPFYLNVVNQCRLKKWYILVSPNRKENHFIHDYWNYKYFCDKCSNNLGLNKW